jgi:hypothetical protein
MHGAAKVVSQFHDLSINSRPRKIGVKNSQNEFLGQKLVDLLRKTLALH